MRVEIFSEGVVMRKAFTLVELLVVMAVIGILAAIILPAVQMAREAARRAQCIEHQRNIAIALQHYENSMGSLPGWRDFIPVALPEGVLGPRNPGDEIVAQASWVFSILPHVEEGDLFSRLKTGQVSRTTAFPRIGILNCPSQVSESPDNRAMNYVVNTGAVDDFSDTDPFVTTDGDLANGPFLDRVKIVAGVIPDRCPCGNDRCRYNANTGKFRHAIARLSDISKMDGTACTLLTSENVQRGFWISPDIVHFSNDRDGNSPALTENDWIQLPDGRWTVSLSFDFSGVAGHTIEGSIGFCWPRFYAEPDSSDYWLCQIAYPRASYNVLGNSKQGFTDACDGDPRSGPFSFDRGNYDTERIPVWLNKFSRKDFGGSWYQSARPSSSHVGAVVVSFCDSNVRTLNQDISEVVFVQLMTAGGPNSDAGWRFPAGAPDRNFIEGRIIDTGMFGK